AKLALGFGYFFLHRFFLLFLFLEFVADEFKNGDFRSITDANAGGNDASVAARAIRELRRDVAEEFFRHRRRHDLCARLPPRLQGVPLAERNHPFRNRPRSFRASQRGGDAPMLKKIGHQVPQRRAAVPWIASQFRSRFQVSHVSSLSLGRLTDRPNPLPKALRSGSGAAAK